MKNLIFLLFALIFSNCSGQNNFFWSYNNVATTAAPTVTTTAISAITSTTATSGGNVTSDGGASVTARGVCWNTSTNPTITNSHTSDGTGTGSFSSSLTSLTDGSTYYVRAYATNSAGTSYGSNVSFTTLCAYLPAGMPYWWIYLSVKSTTVTSGNVCYLLGFGVPYPCSDCGYTGGRSYGAEGDYVYITTACTFYADGYYILTDSGNSQVYAIQISGGVLHYLSCPQ